MDRFPLLNLYRVLLLGLAGLVLLVGITAAIAESSEKTVEYNEQTGRLEETSDFQSGKCLSTLVATFISCVSLVIFAEFIQLALTMEDHLYTIRHSIGSIVVPPSPSISAYSESSLSDSSGNAAPASPASENPQSAINLPNSIEFEYNLKALVNVERVKIMKKPNGNAFDIIGVAMRDQELTLVGRTYDSSFVRLNYYEQEAWVEASQLKIEGDITTLPIMT
ncbi:MAG TPA: hypothetical protein VHP83_13770 [Aggregatilineaceae bacterium]|nr:hypothetical protein [Aggregatilineaceae bacterium]